MTSVIKLQRFRSNHVQGEGPMRIPRRILRPVFCVFFAAVCLITLPVLFSQTTAGLTGALTDSSGAVMPGVKVTLVNTETGAQREVVTNDSGIYGFTALPPGVYKLTFQQTGFAQETREGIRLEVNQVARVDVSMRPGAIAENVEVTGAAAPLLEASTSQVGQVIDTRA